jgi:hypothetical protein
LLASRVYVDLVDTDEPTARRLLLAGVGESGAADLGPIPRHARKAVSWAGP